LRAWAVVSIWEPIRVHLPWIEQVPDGLKGARAFELVHTYGRWRCPAEDDKMEHPLDDPDCFCVVM
jgi:hypothetical protein